jgi:hypothetical protein
LDSLVSEVQSQVQAQNGALLFWYTTNIMANWENASSCYSEISGAGMNDKNIYANSPAPSQFTSGLPGFAGPVSFVNLKTATVMGIDASGSYLSNAQLVQWATQANQ